MTLGNNLMRLTSPLRCIGRNIKEGRQRTANQQIARMLQETEYRNESVDTVYRALCRQDFSSLRGYPTK